MNYRMNHYFARSAALAICLAPALVYAQQQDGAAAQPAPELASPDPSAVVIVTGVTKTTTKKNATFSINTLGSEEIQRLAPMSTADLLANFPGIYT